MLLLLAFQHVGDARVLGEDYGHHVGLELRDDLVGVGIPVQVGAHRDRPVALLPNDGRRAPAQLRGRHRLERHRRAVGQPDPHVLHVRQGAPFAGRIADHHLHLVAAPLDALDLGTVEGLSHLPAHVVEAEPQRLGPGEDRELEFLLALPARVPDVEYAGVVRQGRGDLPGRGFERGHVVAPELQDDRVPEAAVLSGECEFLGARDRTHPIAPLVCDLGGADAANLRRAELHAHLPEVRLPRPGAPPSRSAPGLLAHHAQHVLHHRGLVAAPARVELQPQLRGRRLESPDGGPRLAHRCAQRHGELRPDAVGHHGRHHRGLQMPAHEQRQAEHEQDARDRRRDVAPLDAAPHGRRVDVLHEIAQAARNPGLEARPGEGEAALRHPPDAGPVGQVRGEHELRLDEGEPERDHHHAANADRHGAGVATDERKRPEGGDRRQDAEDDRCRDFLGAANRPSDRIRRVAFLVGVDVLAGDDRIVDEDSERHDEGERRQQVDVQLEQGHQGERAAHRDGHAERHPERGAQLEKDREQDDHQQESEERVPGHHRQAIGEVLRVVVPHRELNALRNLHPSPVQVFLDLTGDLDHLLLPHTEDVDHHGRLPVEA